MYSINSQKRDNIFQHGQRQLKVAIICKWCGITAGRWLGCCCCCCCCCCFLAAILMLKCCICLLIWPTLAADTVMTVDYLPGGLVHLAVDLASQPKLLVEIGCSDWSWPRSTCDAIVTPFWRHCDVTERESCHTPSIQLDIFAFVCYSFHHPSMDSRFLHNSDSFSQLANRFLDQFNPIS